MIHALRRTLDSLRAGVATPPSPNRTGGAIPSPLLISGRTALPLLALFATAALGLWLLLSGGILQAQDANGLIKYAENRTDPVTTYTAVDPEGTDIDSWSLAGTDARAFTIEGGVLRFAKTPDYEVPTDVIGTGGSTAAAGDRTYEITVEAVDSTGKTGIQEVMVEVTNVDEDGTVALSARQPRATIPFTASLTDPDGTATNVSWQWAKSRSKNGSYTDIDGAEEARYDAPTDATGRSDVDYYLRATVSYTDPEGSGKSAMMKSDYMVQATRGSNNSPAFPADFDLVTEDVQGPTREVAENTEAGTDIGAPVAATDEDGDDVLTYTLTDEDGGTEGDSASFSIDWATGQLMTKGDLNHEDTDCTDGDVCTYTVVVRATDPFGVPQTPIADIDIENSDVVTVVITVTDVNEAPAVTRVGAAAAVTFAEITGDITESLATYTATDQDVGGPTPTWSVAGPDGSKFTAVGGELRFKAKPDYENATDANTNNVYEVTVQASDGKLTGMRKVRVTVENEGEVGVVTLSKTQPRVGIAVTASLTDPDDSISNLRWQWSITGAAPGQVEGVDVPPTPMGDIEDANSASYTPKAGDVGGALTATASYTDGYGPTKTVKRAALPVKLDTRNRAPAFADQDHETDGVQNDMATRMVDENTEAVADDAADATDDTDDNVGGVVKATDPDPNEDRLTYTLGGADAAKFRVRTNGQIEVGSGTELDYETKQTYMVTLTAEDSFVSSSSIDITIEVNPIDEMPDMSGEETPEYAENGTDPVTTYTAVDPEGTDIDSWSLAGTDADAFTIEGGVLRFAKTPDYEAPTDVLGTGDSTAAAGDRTYEITVEAMDSTGKTGMQEVMVEVTNVDEDGTVTFSARQPLAGIPFTASLADPDGTATNPKWQWAKSRSENGSYTDIDGAKLAGYAPTDASGESDIGYYLRATVSYTDPEGSGKSAMMKSDYMVQATRGSNNTPAFADDQDPVTDGVQVAAPREVAENTEAGTDIGAPVVAEDGDDDILTYTLAGPNADSFDIDWATGQIMTKAALDYETTLSYIVVVQATDPFGVPKEGITEGLTANSAEVTVNIAVTNVNEAPAVAAVAEDAAVTFAEITGDITESLGGYTADDPETGGDNNTDVVTWSVAGPDGSKFTAVGGELRFKAKPDYENATDANTNNVYEVTVQATDANGNRGMKEVKVTVTNEEEDGVVTLSRTQPRVGIAVTASLTDPDDSISNLRWQWSITGAAPGQVEGVDVPPTPMGDIEDANSASYTPKAGDVGGALTAKASYTDGHDANKMANESPQDAVGLDTRNRAPAFADQDPDTAGVQNDMATRTVDENTEAVAADDALANDPGTENLMDNVGGVVKATDPDPNAETEVLTYTLGGADAAKFRVRTNGQIEVGSGTELDYETKRTYMVTLTAEDSFASSSSIDVTIEVNPIDEVPEIRKGGLAISGMSSLDYAENGADAVETYTANGPNATSATWSLEGADAGDFTISAGGVLTFTSPPDYEDPADADTDNTYMVTVKAGDGTYTAMREVTVRVTDVVDETTTPTENTLLDRYDTNDNEMIDKTEVVAAINAYLFDEENAPSKDDVIDLINLYLGL